MSRALAACHPELPHAGGGLCRSCYTRTWRSNNLPLSKHGYHWRRSGLPRTAAKAPLEERFHSYVCPEPNSGCWLWIGANIGYARPTSYGSLWVKEQRRTVLAHRVAYMLYRGPIPEGKQIDHRCRNPRCVNPEHLDLVTNAENARRRYAAPHCPTCTCEKK